MVASSPNGDLDPPLVPTSPTHPILISEFILRVKLKPAKNNLPKVEEMDGGKKERKEEKKLRKSRRK